MRIWRAGALLVALASQARAQAVPPPTVATLGDCVLESGATLPDCRLSYRVFGTMDATRSNVVLLPTWFNGTSAAWLPFLGPEGFVDTTRFAAIAVDAFGAGRSSAPADSAWRGRAFPATSIADMVRAQRRLLDQLGVTRLHAVVGISMGAMQALEWAVAYPEAASHIVSIVGSPRLSTYDRVLWGAMLDAVESAPRLGVPRDSSLRQLARLTLLAGTTPAAVNRRPADSTAAAVEGTARGLRARPFENIALQLHAMLGHDVSRHTGGDLEAAARRIRARVLVVVSPDDHVVTPQSVLAFASLAGAEVLEVPCACGHQVFAVERARVGAAVRGFLGR